jgi:precorrin-6B methylase 2
MKNVKLLTFCLLFLIPSAINCQDKIRKFVPVEGQEGKDVPWIPTPQVLVDKMLYMAKITPSDFLIDLGSGDGRTVITAAKRGTRALGIEYNPDFVALAKENAAKEGVASMTEFIKADVFEYDFSKATVITMFLLPELNMKLRPKLLNLKPGTRILTNTFTMQDWKADETVSTGMIEDRWNIAYMWIVPAKVKGEWTLQNGDILSLDQKFQVVTGSLKTSNKVIPVNAGKLRGNEISFTTGEQVYNGIVTGKRMEGSLTSKGKTGKWMAGMK